MKIAFMGLGRMGWPIAAHLAASDSNHEFSVFDIDVELARQWQAAHGGSVAPSPAAAVTDAQLVVTSVPADQALADLLQSAGPSVTRGATWVDHSTTSADAARAAATELHARHADFLDAPVSGGVDGACAGTLTVMAGGTSEAFALAEPLMAAYAQRVTHMGASGSGQLAKMTNQICVVGLCQALAEGLDFASQAGLDTNKMVQVMLQGSSASWQMENRSASMLKGEYDFGFSTALMRKDIGLVLNQARSIGASLPVTALVDQLLTELDSMGGAQWDWSALMERQRRSATNAKPAE